MGFVNGGHGETDDEGKKPYGQCTLSLQKIDNIYAMLS